MTVRHIIEAIVVGYVVFGSVAVGFAARSGKRVRQR